MRFPAVTALTLLGLIPSSAVGQTSAPSLLRSFQRIALSDQFWCEGASAADFNKDGKADIVAGPWWWAGPDFKDRHEIYAPTATFELTLGESTKVTVPGFEGGLGKKNAYSDNFFAFPYDFNNDGWQDVLVVGFPGQLTVWYENPKGAADHWARHPIFMQTDNEFANIYGHHGRWEARVSLHHERRLRLRRG